MVSKEFKKNELAGRIALVTGSSKGIGREITLTLAREGADVIICGRDKNALDKTALDIKKLGVNVSSFVLNATKPEEVKSLFKEIVAPMGRLDILVNNIGGVRQFSKFSEISDEDWHEVFETNLMTTVRFTREAIQYLQKSAQARIINIASNAGKQPSRFNPHYGAIKAGVIHLSKHLANSLGESHIRVNSVCSSTIKGEGVWERDVKNKARIEGLSFDEAEMAMEKLVRSKSPLGEIGTPEDVAELVAFLASDKAKFITGTCIQVDGGTLSSIF